MIKSLKSQVARSETSPEALALLRSVGKMPFPTEGAHFAALSLAARPAPPTEEVFDDSDDTFTLAHQSSLQDLLDHLQNS